MGAPTVGTAVQVLLTGCRYEYATLRVGLNASYGICMTALPSVEGPAESYRPSDVC